MSKKKRIGWFILFCLVNAVIPMVPFHIGCQMKNDGNFILTFVIVGIAYFLMEIRQNLKKKIGF